ncbi:cytochrome c biogenesis CcdA family protein [Methanobrevibacter sp. UBA412]|uniref:cytochrome c biogenesis CcdA family protein n=1 Tax=Methanobrevibacter sp. UBA412 TaxID=1915486 RepID=UPI0039B9C297
MDFMFIISFLVGITSVLSPCVLPVIPIIIAYSFLERDKIETLVFTLGLFSVFFVIIILSMIFTATITHYLHWIRILASLILIFLGLVLLFNLNLFNFNLRVKNNKTGLLKSFLMGLVTSLAWAPCYGSYLLSLMSVTISKGNVVYTGLNLLSYTLGFAFTIYLIGFIVSEINFKKINEWSNIINRICGLIILIVGVYMLLAQYGILL